MKKFIFKIFKLSFIAFVLINMVSFMSLYLLSKSEFYKPSYLVNHFEKTTKFDYVILGSSRGLTTINTNLIDDKLKTKGVNLSIDDTGLSTHSLMLTHFFENGFKAQKVILTLDSAFFSESNVAVGDNDYRFLPFVTNDYVSDYYSKYENSQIKKLSYSKYVPFFGVSYYNLELFFPSLLTVFNPQRHNRFDDNGNYQYPNQTLNSIKSVSVDNVSINNPMLLDLKRLCSRNNTELIIYIAPMFNTKLNINTSLDVKVVNHVNLIKEGGSFYDVIHVNQRGREIATAALMKYINK